MKAPLASTKGFLSTGAWFAAFFLGGICFRSSSHAAEVTVNAGQLRLQILSVNRGDTVRWVSGQNQNRAIQSFGGEYALNLEASNSWSASYQFNVPMTNYYLRSLPGVDINKAVFGVRGGIVIVRDWTNEPPAVTLHSPVEGMVFNHGEKYQEPIPFLATTTTDPERVLRVDFLSNGTAIDTFTDLNIIYAQRLGPGAHTLVARVTEIDGIVRESEPVHIFVEAVAVPRLDVRYVRELNLVVVSWITAANGLRYDMARASDPRELPGIQTSSTVGVRFWLERASAAEFQYYGIRASF